MTAVALCEIQIFGGSKIGFDPHSTTEKSKALL
jgi:hypothetical protein